MRDKNSQKARKLEYSVMNYQVLGLNPQYGDIILLLFDHRILIAILNGMNLLTERTVSCLEISETSSIESLVSIFQK